MPLLKSKNNWGAHEHYLGKQRLLGDVEVEAEFPEGATRCWLKLRKFNSSVGDMGHSYPVADSVPYLEISYKGAPVLIDLYPNRKDIKIKVLKCACVNCGWKGSGLDLDFKQGKGRCPDCSDPSHLEKS